MVFRYIVFIKVIYENYLVLFRIVVVYESFLKVFLGYIWGFVLLIGGYFGGVLGYYVGIISKIVFEFYIYKNVLLYVKCFIYIFYFEI